MNKYLSLIFATAITWASCKEQPIDIPPLGTNNPVTTFATKNILVEEFTGVKCVNCPDGAIEIENLKKKYGEQLIPVSIHAGIFAKKMTESKYEFKITQGSNILKLLGEPDGYPSVVINRKPLGDNSSLVVVGQGKWAGLIQNESKNEAEITLELKPTYDATNRTLSLVIDMTPLVNLNNNLRMSVMLTEDNIVDAQVVPQKGVVTDYNHRHVLRDMLTNYDGNPITENLTKGSKVQKTFTYTVPTTFQESNCEIVAFIHKSSPTKEVIQAAAKKILK